MMDGFTRQGLKIQVVKCFPQLVILIWVGFGCHSVSGEHPVNKKAAPWEDLGSQSFYHVRFTMCYYGQNPE